MTYQDGKPYLKGVEQITHKKTIHPFLNEHFHELKMDKDQTLWLREVVYLSNLSEAKINSIISATRYVILAHDIHETINEKKNAVQYPSERRELTVLAGDFYSALYYRIIAETGMIPLLNALQRGIQKMNAAKANIYQLDSYTEEEYLTELTASYIAIFSEFAHYFGRSKNFIYLAEKTILLGKLQKEVVTFRNSGKTTLKKAYRRYCFAHKDMEGFESWLTSIINKTKKDVKTSFETVELLQDVLVDRIHVLMES